MEATRRTRIGLALGGGAARGWAHVGVIRALEEAGIRPDLVVGTSAGALVGAVYAAGELDRFEEWLLGLGVIDVVSFLDVHLGGGMLKGERLMEFFRRTFVDRPIGQLRMPYGAVAAALFSGEEVWLRDGSTVEAVRASIAIPGILTPVPRDGRMLADGGLVDPVPVSLARAMGADLVIAVDLNSGSLGTSHPGEEGAAHVVPAHLPHLPDALASGITIMQARITAGCFAVMPPDAVVTPRLAHIGLFEFHRAADAIAEGRRAASEALATFNPAIKPPAPS
jgi:NTE family protein